MKLNLAYFSVNWAKSYWKMALKMAIQRSTRVNVAGLLGLRWTHATALPPPLDLCIDLKIALPPLILPEFDRQPVVNLDNKGYVGFGLPSFSFGGSMELMAVPKRKVLVSHFCYAFVEIRALKLISNVFVQTSPHKRGIRNGPKALKPTPVIIRCK